MVYIVIEEKERKKSFSDIANVDKNTKVLNTVRLSYFSVYKLNNTCNVNWLWLFDSQNQ